MQADAEKTSALGALRLPPKGHTHTHTFGEARARRGDKTDADRLQRPRGCRAGRKARLRTARFAAAGPLQVPKHASCLTAGFCSKATEVARPAVQVPIRCEHRAAAEAPRSGSSGATEHVRKRALGSTADFSSPLRFEGRGPDEERFGAVDFAGSSFDDGAQEGTHFGRKVSEADHIADVMAFVGRVGAALCDQGQADGLADLVWAVAEGLRRLARGKHPFCDEGVCCIDSGIQPPGLGADWFWHAQEGRPQSEPFCGSWAGAQEEGSSARCSQVQHNPSQLAVLHPQPGRGVRRNSHLVAQSPDTADAFADSTMLELAEISCPAACSQMPAWDQMPVDVGDVVCFDCADVVRCDLQMEEPAEIWFECVDNLQCGESLESPSVQIETVVKSSGSDSEDKNLVPLPGHGFMTVEDLARARAVDRSWLSIVDVFVQTFSGRPFQTAVVEFNLWPAERKQPGRDQRVERIAEQHGDVPTAGDLAPDAKSRKAVRRQERRKAGKNQHQQKSVAGDSLGEAPRHGSGSLGAKPERTAAQAPNKSAENKEDISSHAEDSQELQRASVEKTLFSMSKVEEGPSDARPWQGRAHFEVESSVDAAGSLCSDLEGEGQLEETCQAPQTPCPAMGQDQVVASSWGKIRSDIEQIFASLESFEDFRAFRRKLVGIDFGNAPREDLVDWFRCFRQQLDFKCQRPWG